MLTFPVPPTCLINVVKKGPGNPLEVCVSLVAFDNVVRQLTPFLMKKKYIKAFKIRFHGKSLSLVSPNQMTTL